MNIDSIAELQDNLMDLVDNLTTSPALLYEIKRMQKQHSNKQPFNVGWAYLEQGMAVAFFERLMKRFEDGLNTYKQINPINHKHLLQKLLARVNENEKGIKEVSSPQDKHWPNLNEAIKKVKSKQGTLTGNEAQDYFIYRLHQLLFISIDKLQEVLSYQIDQPLVKPVNKQSDNFTDRHIFNKETLSKLHEAFNGELFENKFPDFYMAFNDPENAEYTINIIGSKNRFYYLIDQLAIYFNKTDFGKSMCAKQKLDFKTYTVKKATVANENSKESIEFKKKIARSIVNRN